MTQAPAPGFKTNPDYRITFEPSPRRVRVKFNGEWVVDSTAAHLLFETCHLPIYYFPRADARMDLLRSTEHHSYCPYEARHRIGASRLATGSPRTRCGPIPNPHSRGAVGRLFKSDSGHHSVDPARVVGLPSPRRRATYRWQLAGAPRQ